MQIERQQVFKALSDPTRREILTHLSNQQMSIADIAANFTMTRAAVKKHLKILENGGLVSVRSIGREKINSLRPEGLKLATDWLSYFEQFWDQKIENLNNIIKIEKGKTHDT